jgi:hypothetical protein
MHSRMTMMGQQAVRAIPTESNFAKVSTCQLLATTQSKLRVWTRGREARFCQEQGCGEAR